VSVDQPASPGADPKAGTQFGPLADRPPGPLGEPIGRRVLAALPPWSRPVLLGGLGLGAAWPLAAHLLPAGLPFGVVLLGVVLGALDALTAVGLVLVYRAARVVNFAQADIGGLAAGLAVVLVTGAHLPFLLAAPLGLGVALLTGWLMDATVVRRFFKAPRLILTVATIGVAQILGAGELGLPTLFHHLSPLSTFTTPFHLTFDVGPVLFTGNDVVAMAVVPLVLAGLWWFLGHTRRGVAIRAAADADERASLLGVPVRRLSRVTWVLAAGLSGLAALLSSAILGPNLGVVAGPTALLVPLAAAVVAGMESLPLAVAAAIGLDVVQQAVLWSYPRSSTVDVVVFVVVLLAVLVRRRSLGRIGGDQSLGVLTTGRDRPLPEALRQAGVVRWARRGLLLAGLAAAALVPLALSAPRVIVLTGTAIDALVAVSMVVLVGWAGQLSLGQYAFVGIGAALTGALMVHGGADLFLAMLAGAAAGGLAALVLGLPSLRVPGLFLGVVTMAFAVPVSTWLLDSTYFPWLTPALVPRPDLLGRIDLASPYALYEFCLAVLALAMLLARNFRRSRAGRVVLAVRDNDRAAAAYGVAPWRSKLTAATFSGMLAGLAGGLEVLNLRGVPFSGFNPEDSIVVFTMVVVGGLGSLPGALLGAFYVEGAQYFLGGAAQLVATGAGLVVLLMVLPGGLGEVLGRFRDLLLRRSAQLLGLEVPALARTKVFAAAPAGEPAGTEVPASRTTTAADGGRPVPGGPPPVLRRAPLAVVPGVLERQSATASQLPGAALRIEALDAGYGQLQVLFGAELAVAPGEVVALLGTNGAGKSTLLRAAAGTLGVKAGRVLLDGVDVTHWPTEERVAAGLVMVPGGRGVFPSLTVAENLQVASWLRLGGPGAEDFDEVLTLFPALGRRLSTPAGLLSGGEQQMLTLAQAMRCRPRVLLIDELSLGLAPSVVAQLLEVVRSLADQGLAVVVVEQSLNVAAALAPQAIFLERGQVRFQGATRDLLDRGDLARAVLLGGAAPLEPGPDGLGGRRPLAEDPGRRRPGWSPPGRGPWPVALPDALDDWGSPSEPTTAALALRDVSVRFGGIQALDGVDLVCQPGEVLAVIGANGAGKTTLFDAISGFVGVRSGEIRLHGEDLTGLPPAARAERGLGRLFQEARIFPSLTVAEALAVAAERHLLVRDPFALTVRLADARRSEDEVEAVVAELLARFGLETVRDAFVGELSTGTRRVVELAGAFAHRPSVLLADEPSAGIAQREVEALSDLLLHVREETGCSLLVIDHDVPLLRRIADRMVCLHLGRVLAVGTPAEVLGDPAVAEAYLGGDPAALARSG
jgi:branched-chain amino acid transport system permease protein